MNELGDDDDDNNNILCVVLYVKSRALSLGLQRNYFLIDPNNSRKNIFFKKDIRAV